MTKDTSNGWDDVADKFIELRTDTGVDVVSRWADLLPDKAAILDLGCGFGAPISEMLYSRGFQIHGIEASPKLASDFQQRLPDANVRCEAVEVSDFFGKKFDGVIAVGLMFLMQPNEQRDLIRNTANALNPKGRFLFSAPYQVCQWDDFLTGRTSQSLGKAEYINVAQRAGLKLVDTHEDVGENHYFEMIRI